VTGRGERVEPVELPPEALGLSLVLANPGLPIRTAGAFRLLDERRLRAKKRGQDAACGGACVSACGGAFGGAHGGGGFGREALRGILAGPPREWPFFSDFARALEGCAAFSGACGGANSGAASGGAGTPGEAEMACAGIISELLELGADFAGLSGSGSTCFGVFSHKSKAECAKERLFGRWPFVLETFCLRARQFDGKMLMWV